MVMFSPRLKASRFVMRFASLPNAIEAEHDHWMASGSKSFDDRPSQGK
jgi:hypothetical protein